MVRSTTLLVRFQEIWTVINEPRPRGSGERNPLPRQ